MDNEKKVALFIDAENVGAEYADKVISVARGYGELIIKRIYGGSKTRPIAEWREKSGEYAILSEIRYVYTAKKNASDISLAVDVMNTLHERNIDVFCIASSDSDFTALAHELRERGKKVIGMGMTTANPTYKSALSEPYIELDSLVKHVNADKTEKTVEKIENKQSIDKVIDIVISTIEALIADKGSALMATLGNRLRNSKELDFSAFYEKNKDGNLTDFLLKFDEINSRYKKIGKKTDTTLVKKDMNVSQTSPSENTTMPSKPVDNKAQNANTKALVVMDKAEQRQAFGNRNQSGQPKGVNDNQPKNTSNNIKKNDKPSNENPKANDNANAQVNQPKKVDGNINNDKAKENKKYRGNRTKKVAK